MRRSGYIGLLFDAMPLGRSPAPVAVLGRRSPPGEVTPRGIEIVLSRREGGQQRFEKQSPKDNEMRARKIEEAGTPKKKHLRSRAISAVRRGDVREESAQCYSNRIRRHRSAVQPGALRWRPSEESGKERLRSSGKWKPWRCRAAQRASCRKRAVSSQRRWRNA